MGRRKKLGSSYVETITSLLTCSDPVSFYDAFTLTRQLRGQEPSNPVVTALLQLHDAGHVTDGARDVLADSLRGLAVRQENQRLIAQRAVTLRDDAKTARATVGDRLALHLEERRAAGYRWEVDERLGPGYVKRDPRSVETQSTAVFDVQLQKPGQLELTLAERPPPADTCEDEEEDKRFRLTVIIDEKT